MTKKKKIFQSVLTTEVVLRNFVMKGNVVRLSLGGSIPVCITLLLDHMRYSDLAQGSWLTGALASCAGKAFLFVFLISCACNDCDVVFFVCAGVHTAGIPFGLCSLTLNVVSGNR